ncbi:MAG: HDOD domain-containing protein [bacterium]|nr:HDOD domain-containing protein [bacterium]
MNDMKPVLTRQDGQLDLAGFMDGIPPLPFIITFVLELTDKDDLSAVALAHAVEADPGLTARILRVSNSAFYSPVERVYTVRDAINYIGFETVRSLTVTNTVVKGLWVEDENFSKQMFWRHSLRCGLFARTIAHALQLQSPDILFTLGVLHDVGRAAIIQQDPKLYQKALEFMHHNGVALWQAEQKVFGYNHADVGGFLAQSGDCRLFMLVS